MMRSSRRYCVSSVPMSEPSPVNSVHNLTAVLGDDTLEFVSDLLHLCIGQNRRDNENGFVIVHNTF